MCHMHTPIPSARRKSISLTSVSRNPRIGSFLLLKELIGSRKNQGRF